MRALLFFLLAAAALAQGPRVVYSKSFPGSMPAYVKTIVNRDGNCEFTDIVNDEQPMKFKLTEPETNTIFELAAKLDLFKKPLESGLKVANMGAKSFRWEDGKDQNEAKFNYSTEPDAQLLLDWFEKITESELNLINLEKTARFDKLGVNSALLQLEVAWDKKRLVAPDQFLKMLDRVAKNEAYLHMARDRAARLAEVIRGPEPKKAE